MIFSIFSIFCNYFKDIGELTGGPMVTSPRDVTAGDGRGRSGALARAPARAGPASRGSDGGRVGEPEGRRWGPFGRRRSSGDAPRWRRTAATEATNQGTGRMRRRSYGTGGSPRSRWEGRGSRRRSGQRESGVARRRPATGKTTPHSELGASRHALPGEEVEEIEPVVLVLVDSSGAAWDGGESRRQRWRHRGREREEEEMGVVLVFLHGRPCRLLDLQNGPLRAFFCKMAAQGIVEGELHRGHDAVCPCRAGPARDRRRIGPTFSDPANTHHDGGGNHCAATANGRSRSRCERSIRRPKVPEL